ncbi:hypothetical protein COY95_05105, partial [Candidatus Woesearchaeota archaeon CG_4_10_14_0_8_um_filter_47_5]
MTHSNVLVNLPTRMLGVRPRPMEPFRLSDLVKVHLLSHGELKAFYREHMQGREDAFFPPELYSGWGILYDPKREIVVNLLRGTNWFKLPPSLGDTIVAYPSLPEFFKEGQGIAANLLFDVHQYAWYHKCLPYVMDSALRNPDALVTELGLQGNPSPLKVAELALAITKLGYGGYIINRYSNWDVIVPHDVPLNRAILTELGEEGYGQRGVEKFSCLGGEFPAIIDALVPLLEAYNRSLKQPLWAFGVPLGFADVFCEYARILNPGSGTPETTDVEGTTRDLIREGIKGQNSFLWGRGCALYIESATAEQPTPEHAATLAQYLRAIQASRTEDTRD